jgi:hypothetical protein
MNRTDFLTLPPSTLAANGCRIVLGTGRSLVDVEAIKRQAAKALLGLDSLPASSLLAAYERRAQLLQQECWYLAPPATDRRRGGAKSSQSANALRRSRALLGAWDGKAYIYPAFQFDRKSGELLPEVRELLTIMPADRTGWRPVFWLYQKHGALEGMRPADVFSEAPGRVIEAARGDFVLSDAKW